MVGIATVFIALAAFVATGVLKKWDDLLAGADRRLDAMTDLTKASAEYLTAVAAAVLLVNEVVPGSPFAGF